MTEDLQRADSPQYWHFQVELQLTIIKGTKRKRNNHVSHLELAENLIYQQKQKKKSLTELDPPTADQEHK